MMKAVTAAALSVGALIVFPTAVNAAEVSTDTTHAIVETVLNDLGVDASAELVDLITADVGPLLLNPEIVDALDTALAEGSDPTQVIDDITDENFDEQSVLWEENGDEWTATAPAVRPNRHSTSDPDDDGEDETETETETEVDESPTPRPTASVRPSPNPRPTKSTRPTSTPRPTPSDSGEDDDDDDEGDDEDHSDDDD